MKHDAIETPFGKVRIVIRDGRRALNLCCPGCGAWGALDDDQAHGRISVDHAADGCPGGYHETHNFVAALGPEEQEAFALDGGYHYADPKASNGG